MPWQASGFTLQLKKLPFIVFLRPIHTLPSTGQHPSQLCIQGFLLFSSPERSLQVQGRGHGGSKRAELVQRRGPSLHFPWQFSFCFQNSRDGPSGDPEADGKGQRISLSVSTKAQGFAQSRVLELSLRFLLPKKWSYLQLKREVRQLI